MQTKNTSPKGTYVGLRVVDPSNVCIFAHCQAEGIPVKQSMFERRLHTTLIYSRKHAPEIVTEPETMHIAAFKGYDLFKGQQGENVLVMLLDCPTIVARHKQLMASHDLTYDFPVYHPHITLSYNYNGNTVMGLAPYTLPIVLGLEYMEDLDLNWGK